MKRAVAGIVIVQNKILIGKKVVREGHFVSGGWHIPGGHIKQGESVRKALIRELAEETGLEVSIVKKVCTHLVKDTDTKLSWYICTASTTKVTAMDDLSDVKFVDKANVLKECDRRATSLWPPKVIKYFSE